MTPFLILLYDRTFLASSLRGVFRKRWGLYLALALTWGMLVPAMLVSRSSHLKLAMHAVTAWEYARTQFGVVVHYLRLSLWPVALCLDYQWPVAESAWDIAPPAAASASSWCSCSGLSGDGRGGASWGLGSSLRLPHLRVSFRFSTWLSSIACTFPWRRWWLRPCWAVTWPAGSSSAGGRLCGPRRGCRVCAWSPGWRRLGDADLSAERRLPYRPADLAGHRGQGSRGILALTPTSARSWSSRAGSMRALPATRRRWKSIPRMPRRTAISAWHWSSRTGSRRESLAIRRRWKSIPVVPISTTVLA